MFFRATDSGVYDALGNFTPSYTCGHCSAVVIMHPFRERERPKCMKCLRLLCGKNLLCAEDCTPIHALAKDHFEAPAQYTKFVNAIMGGCITKEEGLEKGLIVP